MSETRTFRDAVASHFIQHRGEWVSAETLMAIGGRMAWRTRTSECRTQLGMCIENRTRRLGAVKVSEYRYVPASLLEEASV